MEIVVGGLRTVAGLVAVDRAAEEVRRAGGRLHVVGYVPVPRDNVSADSYQRRVRALEHELTDWIAERAGDLDVVVHVPSGHWRPARAILHVSEQVAADLIVIGLRRRSKVAMAVLGSTAHDVLAHARCAVLGVPVVEPAAA